MVDQFRANALAINAPCIGLRIPVPQHPAFAGVAFQMMQMFRRPVGVAVDEAREIVFAQQVVYGFVVDVHDVHGFAAFGLFALRAQLFDLCFAFGQRLGEELRAPVGAAHGVAELLVGRIVGAERIAVTEQGGRAVQVDERRVGEQLCATGGRQRFVHQEVPVAVHDADLCALRGEGGECVADRSMEGAIKVVVAGPVFEQVAEDVEGFCLRRVVLREVQELLRRARMGLAQVQVGDEEGVGHYRIRDLGFRI